ncbi:Nucleolar protein 8 [Rhynchospora pubera]|uniref:Nucleolar protein 8 n=1 Tax=Rhynchospora pubera TaxID=906938 RepID=A0AAV8EMJ3_9POAL|nr:Nucleolar protein 8 [Rhynchospora pubera]
MVETVEEGMGASGTPSAIRIFIGGLGASVTTDDIEKLFSSLGRVRNVEFVRTNGRNFGYMDFEPQSDKALAKLFSTYNGCKWKGGKLRMGKAKEHYLSRLRREWEADAAASVPAEQEVEITNEEKKSKNLDLNSMKISIFFPKLKKIKLLPYKGSAKHKYSFQRVEVPSTLPLHFCDCEEHCGPLESVNQTYLSALDSAAHEKELSIMHSVMNKLLKESGEKQEELGADLDVAELVEKNTADEESEEERGEEVVEEVAKEESEEESDEDLVINISGRMSDESLLDFTVSDVVPPNQELKEKNHQMSAEEIPKRNVQKHTSKALKTPVDGEKPPVATEKTTVDEFSSHLPRSSSSSMKNHIQPEPTDQKTTEKSGKSSNIWFQKSAWRDLVGDTTQNLFGNSSSTQLSVNSNLSNQPVSESKASDPTITSRKRKVMSNQEGQNLTPTETETVAEDENKQAKQEVRRVVQKVKVGEVCSFMRSAESEKEWNKTKKALSGYMKKKKEESGSGSGVRKGAPFHVKRFVK